MGRIVSIKRMAVHDGDGLRTTLFLKGCPLRCRWCHNPESLATRPQVAWYPAKCIGCGACKGLCEAITHASGRPQMAWDRCRGCGQCAQVCLSDAFVFYGKEYTAEEVLPLLLEDAPFYGPSGGGVTLSGGEPLLQAAFSAQVLALVRAQGISTALDTCGFAPREALDAVLPHTDTVLYDLKAVGDTLHRALTGQSNRQILDNLLYLDARGVPIEIRIPYIPTMNDGEIDAMGRLLAPLDAVRRVTVLPYHPFAGSKYEALGMTCDMPSVPRPDLAALDAAVATLQQYGLDASHGGA